MLTIKTYLDKSNISGIGLFAGEFIKKGTITWKFSPLLDIYFSKKDYSLLPENTKEFINEYGSLSKVSNKYIISIDNTRFTNHSSTPNLDSIKMENEPELVAIANRDINIGEEMTINYKGFDRMSEKSSADYFNH